MTWVTKANNKFTIFSCKLRHVEIKLAKSEPKHVLSPDLQVFPHLLESIFHARVFFFQNAKRMFREMLEIEFSDDRVSIRFWNWNLVSWLSRRRSRTWCIQRDVSCKLNCEIGKLIMAQPLLGIHNKPLVLRVRLFRPFNSHLGNALLVAGFLKTGHASEAHTEKIITCLMPGL